MKKIIHLILLAGLASLSAALAQTNTIPAVDLTNTTAPVVLSTNSETSLVTNQTVTQTVTSTAVTNTTVVTTDVTATNAAPDDASATNAAAAAAAGIPLIQFSDVPITTAIENLARQATINYMLDPKIGYGQPDANGTVKTEPQLSIRWENISAENALIALLDNYGLQLIRDNKTGIDRIALKDPTAPPPLITRVVQLKYSSVTNMTEAVQSVFTDKRSKVLSDSRTSQLVVVATDPEQAAVDTLIASLDKPTKQVLIETKLVEISSNPTSKKGVDWSSTLNAQHVTFGNGSLSGTTTINTPGTPTTITDPNGNSATVTPSSSASSVLSLVQGAGGLSASTVSGLIPTTGFLTADGVSAVISFLNASYDAQVVSTPRIVTLDNEMAKISVTRTYPIIQQTSGTQNSSGSSSVTYSNVGTILQVTPRISANDYIRLTVAPEVSSHFGDITVTVQGGTGNASTSYPIPEFDYRKIESQVLIPNGNTLVMGGLIQDNPTATYSKVPVLGDIPGLGWAFKSESKSMSKDNLIIFLTPTIVRDEDFQATPTDFLKTKSKTMRSPMNPHTVWDGSEPTTDWSNPAPLPDEFKKRVISPDNNNY
jgi:type II secretory pathway component GspD/PulD (secretin)